jgi:hypothetical protein
MSAAAGTPNGRLRQPLRETRGTSCASARFFEPQYRASLPARSADRARRVPAHRCGFTEKVLTHTLALGGFPLLATVRRPHPAYDL